MNAMFQHHTFHFPAPLPQYAPFSHPQLVSPHPMLNSFLDLDLLFFSDSVSFYLTQKRNHSVSVTFLLTIPLDFIFFLYKYFQVRYLVLSIFTSLFFLLGLIGQRNSQKIQGLSYLSLQQNSLYKSNVILLKHQTQER